MERFTVTMNSTDVDLFERRRGELEMSKSAFIRYLIYVNENKEPPFIKYKELIALMGEINSKLNGILVDASISDEDKLFIFEKVNGIKTIVNEYEKGRDK